MRLLGKNITNELRIKAGNDVLVFFYRNPTAAEMVNYGTRVYKLDAQKIKIDASERVKAVLEVLTSIGENVWGDENGDPISSDPNSTNYKENWKDILSEFDSAALQFAAQIIFENIKQVESTNGKLPEIEGIDASPFPRSSTGG